MAVKNEDLLEWLDSLPIWIKDAALTYYEKGSFDEKDVKRFAKECVDEASGNRKKIDVSTLNLLTKDNRQDFSIKSINNIVGVNALASEKSLQLGTSGVTVIYGENGAGKSGYIRILKNITDAKYKEELKQNVYKNQKQKQQCEIVVESNGEEQSLICDLSKEGQYSLLKDIDIFDTRISRAYVEAAKEASYEPWIFTMFSEIARISSLIKVELEDKLAKQDMYEIAVPDSIIDTEIGKKVATINEKTSLDDFTFSWEETDDETLSVKQKEANIDAIKAEASRLSREIEHVDVLVRYLQQFVEFFSETNNDLIISASKDWTDAKELLKAAELLFSGNATELDQKSITNRAWISLWKNAKEYYETVLVDENMPYFSEPNGICPLCGQIISDDERVQRIKSVDGYINGNASQLEREKKTAFLSMLKKCPKSWNEEQIKITIESCGIEGIKEQITNCVEEISKVSTLIWSDNIESTPVQVIQVEEIIHLLGNEKKKKKDKQQNLLDLLQDEDHKKLLSEINVLYAKKWLSDKKGILANHIEYLRTQKLFTKAIKLTATNKITTKSKELAGELLTDEYIARFNNELKKLTRGTVRASLKQQKASKGKIPFQIALENTSDPLVAPSDVLSEGENRVVSLAAFFAEASGRTVQCPLVVDDPISSLDYKYEATVIRRLVEASRHRQVIVFTHRLSMVVGLYDECGKDIPFTEKELIGRGVNKGVPVESAFNGGKSLQKLKVLKNENIARLKKLDENDNSYIEGVHYICQQIRIHVEKSIEDTLLNGVVVRYRKSVQTLNKINWLSEISSEDCKTIDYMMTKYSYYDHSMSDEAPLQEFTLEEIEEDVDKLIEWLTDISNRQKKIK